MLTIWQWCGGDSLLMKSLQLMVAGQRHMQEETGLSRHTMAGPFSSASSI